VKGYEAFHAPTGGDHVQWVAGPAVAFHRQCVPSQRRHAIFVVGANVCGFLDGDNVCIRVPHDDDPGHLFFPSSATPTDPAAPLKIV
jgi:hypothetical protein